MNKYLKIGIAWCFTIGLLYLASYLFLLSLSFNTIPGLWWYPLTVIIILVINAVSFVYSFMYTFYLLDDDDYD